MSCSLYTSPSLRICDNTLRNAGPVWVPIRGSEKKKVVLESVSPKDRHPIYVFPSALALSLIIKHHKHHAFWTCAGIEQGSRYCTFVSRILMYTKKLEKFGEVTFPETCCSFHVTFFPCPDARLVLLCCNKREKVRF